MCQTPKTPNDQWPADKVFETHVKKKTKKKTKKSRQVYTSTLLSQHRAFLSNCDQRSNPNSWEYSRQRDQKGTFLNLLRR